VLTPREIRSVLAQLKGDYRLMAELLYGHVKALLTCRRQIGFGNVLRVRPTFG
jgi:hypothetical protein